VSSYATLVDLNNYGLPETAFGDLTDVQIQAALDEASDDMDAYLVPRYGAPLTAWPTSITRAACVIATWNLLSLRGFNPNSGSDTSVRMRYDDTIVWLTRIQKQMLSPAGIVTTPSPSANPQFLQPGVVTSSATGSAFGNPQRTRGW
jgi:phage gp36-like protein